MTLEHGKDPVSAKWNNDTNTWDIGEKEKYRWLDNTTNQPMSEWFYELTDALQWIKQNEIPPVPNSNTIPDRSPSDSTNP